MYRGAVIGKIISDTPRATGEESIFHHHCYDATMKLSKQITASNLVPHTPVINKTEGSQRLEWPSDNAEEAPTGLHIIYS